MLVTFPCISNWSVNISFILLYCTNLLYFIGGSDLNMGMGPKKSDTIMVKNLPSNTTWQSLKDYFRDCGDIKFAEVGSKGFGIIRFTTEWDAERAISILFLQKLCFYHF